MVPRFGFFQDSRIRVKSKLIFLTWTCLVGAVPFRFLLFGRVELESDAATDTGDSETLFWASVISSPISSVVDASV